MKKALTVVGLLATLVMCACSFNPFGIFDGIIDMKDDHDISYNASTRFLYSTDDGVSWSETIRSVYVGSPYYVAVEMTVAQSQESRTEKEIEAEIAVPKTDGLTCELNSYPGGELKDTIENDTSTTYKFRLVAGTTPSKFRVIFACLPEKEGSTSMTVKYDDHLNEAWDATGTIKYVEPSLGSADNSAEAPDRVTTDESGNPLRDILKPFL